MLAESRTDVSKSCDLVSMAMFHYLWNTMVVCHNAMVPMTGSLFPWRQAHCNLSG